MLLVNPAIETILKSSDFTFVGQITQYILCTFISILVLKHYTLNIKLVFYDFKEQAWPM